MAMYSAFRKFKRHRDADPLYHEPNDQIQREYYERPQTPSSVSPLRDNFDEVTNTRPDRSTAMYDPPTAHSPMGEDFDAPTTTRPTTTVEEPHFNPPRPARPSRPPLHARHCSEGMSSTFFTRPRLKDTLDDFNDYDQFLDETDNRVFRAGSLAQESRRLEILSTKHGDGVTRCNTRESGDRPSQESSTSRSRRNLSFKRNPHSKNEFSMANMKVLQQDAGKTVEVSAWREQVAREAHDDEKMSVYYVTQNDILEAGKGAFQEEFRVTHDLADGDAFEPPFTSTPLLRSHSLSTGSESRPGRKSPFPLAKTRVPPSTRNHGKPPPTPPRSFDSRGKTTPRSSPLGDNSSKGDRNKPLPNLFNSRTQHRMDPDPQMLSTSMRKMTPEVSLESVLADCEPCLSHIGSRLTMLGITSEAHLLAVIRLREETRDREIKDEALKLGITVVEWAIFIDRLLSIIC